MYCREFLTVTSNHYYERELTTMQRLLSWIPETPSRILVNKNSVEDDVTKCIVPLASRWLFESYCCLCSRMVSTFRSQAAWRLSGHYFSWVTSWQIALEIRRRWTFDSNRLICCCKPRYTSDMLTTSCVTELLARAKCKRTFSRFYLEPPSTKFVSTLLQRPCKNTVWIVTFNGIGWNRKNRNSEAESTISSQCKLLWRHGQA